MPTDFLPERLAHMLLTSHSIFISSHLLQRLSCVGTISLSPLDSGQMGNAHSASNQLIHIHRETFVSSKQVALAGASAILALVLVASGCATKRYGRMQAVSGVEKQKYTCDDIEIEMARVVEFRKQIAEGSEINVASVGAFLADLGIGNAMEKNAAEKTATAREAELMALKAEKDC